jgi:hypothetical protein
MENNDMAFMFNSTYKDQDYEHRYSRNLKIRSFDKIFDVSAASKYEWKTPEEVALFEPRKQRAHRRKQQVKLTRTSCRCRWTTTSI